MKKLSRIFFCFFICWGPVLALPTEKNEAVQFIEKLGNQTLAILTQSGQSFEQRKQGFLGILQEFFDVEQIGKFVLGRFVREATPEELAQYNQLFQNRIAQLYAVRFETYNKESFRVKNAIPLKKEGIAGWLVKSEVVRSNGTMVPVDWVVSQTPAGLKVSDVQISGYSLKTQQRDDYMSIIQRNGGKLAGLLEVLAKTQKK